MIVGLAVAYCLILGTVYAVLIWKIVNKKPRPAVPHAHADVYADAEKLRERIAVLEKEYNKFLPAFMGLSGIESRIRDMVRKKWKRAGVKKSTLKGKS